MRKLYYIFFATLFAVVSCTKENPTPAPSSLEMVDLGLSVKWASCNVGATKPEEYGKYFAWGDVTGQTWDGSKWSGGGFSIAPKYEVDANGNLKPEYDAAQVNLGDEWRMPTKAEEQELIDNCTCIWTDNYKSTGVAGKIFTSKKAGYTDKSIFIPAAGYVDNDNLLESGIGGTHWSSTFYNENDDYAWFIYFRSDYVHTNYKYRYRGRSIRPVYGPAKQKQYVSPTSIELLAIKPIYLTTGTQASIEFRINPSNATFVMSGDDCQLVLDKVGAVQTKSSYVTTPTNYKLSKIEKVFDNTTNELKTGQYRVIIEDTKQSAEYDETVVMVLNVKDANGDDVQISSSAFEVVGKNIEDFPKTGLPIVVINTPNSELIDSKTVWVDGSTMTIFNADMTRDYQGTLNLKGRGNSTWFYPKKPYAIKLDSKSKILGMPKHKRWCLLANWLDRTLIRNAMSFEIAYKCPGLSWTPSGKFVELVLNGEHVGNYYLCEQIKVDKNRVNIAELDPAVTEGEGITGGYIMEIDTYYDEVYKFKSAIKQLPWMFSDPDEVNGSQFNYMQNYVNEMEDALYDDARFTKREYTQYLDVDSFVDWWFVNELAMNIEGVWPKSCYMNKDKNGVIKAGPVWDFDWWTFTPQYSSVFLNLDNIYYGRLFEDPDFKKLVKNKWTSQKSDFYAVADLFDVYKSKLISSDEINHSMWPITVTVNGDESLTFDEAITLMKNTYLTKVEWMDSQISQW